MTEEPHDSAAGDLARPTQMTEQVLKLAGSIVILLYLLPPLGYRPTEVETIFNSILFAAGGYLAYSAVRKGHPVLRILGMIVLSPYMVFIAMMISNTSENWSDISRYWFN